ncbi:MAG: xylose isomerase [Sneathiella sp.]|uniref:xylose isomerase n=1 Tax=Sneathiella sp. TaxID=1964365 RepID=UPI0030038F5D
MSEFFNNIKKIKYEGQNTENSLAYRFYDADRIVMGKRMEDHLRFAVCYWHTFCWEGNDPFGGKTMFRPWFERGDPMQMAELKMDVAFEFFEKLGAPYFCFHDRDVAPEGDTLAETNDNLRRLVDKMEGKMEATGRKLLWGTANLFSHHRFMSGAATNPNPEVVAYAAAQVLEALESTHRLGGENYVLWGGREGYDCLLNTDLKQEINQLGRFLNLVVEHKHKIGFKGMVLIEPKPQEPTKHQYDYDSQSVNAFLQKYGLENEVKVNIEANHATLSGHSFEHEIAYAAANGILGSIDMNRGDPQNGWDTDQFPNNVPEITLAMYYILQAGGLTSGGLNFDAKLRRQSIDPADMFHGHIGGMDVCARGLLNAAKMIEENKLKQAVTDRYADWESELGQGYLNGTLSLKDLSERAIRDNLDPKPRSGRQEELENLVNRYC